MLQPVEDTIVAVSTAPGPGLRGVVRLSGGESLAIADSVFVAREGGGLSGRRGFCCVDGEVQLGPDRSLPGQAYVFRGPRSYTRQDCVELHTVGSTALLAALTELVIAHGARLAGPGEFTARAFLAGAMDLSQAEAVAGIIRARSDAELRASLRMNHGQLGDRLAAVGDGLAELVALVEADIDFAEEPIDFIRPAELVDRIDALIGDLETLLEQSISRERLEALPRVLLIGPPNAGKSSLMNALTGLDRAICSAVAGTTRDVLSAPMRTAWGEIILLDAAGYDPGGGAVAALARQALRQASREADLFCLVVDLTGSAEPPGRHPPLAGDDRPVVIAANKVDCVGECQRSCWLDVLEESGLGPVCPVSARTGEGVDALRRQIGVAAAGPGPGAAGWSIALTARQRVCLEAACSALQRARRLGTEAAATLDLADLLAVELREALQTLGELAGAVTTEDLLDRVFSTFCIGK